MARTFTASWLAADPAALALLPDAFRRAEDRARAVAAAAARVVDPSLITALRAQNARYAPSPQRDRHLALLAEPGTVAVVTGQQAGLLVGPLYTIHKACSAIAVARTLQAETGRPCVPIFWLQTEDHDFAEIDHCALPTAAGPLLRLQLPDPQPDAARVPVAHRLLGPGIDAVLAQLEQELGGQPHGPELLALLRAAYRPEATITQAFAQVVAAIFADAGLVLLDPRDPALARLAAPVHRAALQRAPELAAVLEARSRALQAADFAEQVHVRPGSPLSFYAPDGEQGPRYRLDPAGDGALDAEWALVGHPEGACVATAALLDALDREPLRFSTSALLRPILQDTLLPTAAYVGGPGEIAYFAQLGPLYAQFGLTLPLVVPRARFRVLDDRARALLARLGLQPAEAERPRESLVRDLAARAAEGGEGAPAALEADLLASIVPGLARLGERMAALDPNLAKAAARTEDTVRDAVGKLVAKYARALGQRDVATVERLDRLQALLAPGGVPQERVLGLPYFAARFGAQAFVGQVLQACLAQRPADWGRLEDLTP